MSDNIIIYTKEECHNCINAKKLFLERRMTYTDVVINKDITREEFTTLFPGVRTLPHIIINNETVGGYSNLIEWVKNNEQRSFLAE